MTIRNLQFVLFGDYKELEAQPEIIIKISSKLLENGIAMNPGTFQQFNPHLGMKAFERIMFNHTKEKLNVRIGVDAIEINTVITDNKDYNFATHTDRFFSKIKKIIKALKESHENFNSGVRVSLITDIIYDKDKIRPLEEIYIELNNTLPNYDTEDTFEWNTRAVKRYSVTINDSEEMVNFVTEASRASGLINNFGEESGFDTVTTRLDINTIASNNRPRINEQFISEYLEKVNELFSSHNSELEVKIVGRSN